MQDKQDDSQNEFPDIHRPHDKLFKLVFREKEHLADFMRNHLPLEILDVLNMDTLEILPVTFLEEEFSENYTDILAHVQFQEDTLGVYFLFEHKSDQDDWAVWQLLNYMVRQWKKDLNKKKELRPIIPVLFRHGETAWEYRPFSSLFQKTPEIFLEFIPNFRYILHDISDPDREELKGGTVVRLAQLLMRAASSAEPERIFPEILETMRLLGGLDSGMRWLEISLRYLLAATDIRYEFIISEFKERKFSFGEGLIMSTMEKLLEQGREQGIEQGIEQAKLEDARRMLEKGLSLDDVLEITGLSRERLAEARLI